MLRALGIALRGDLGNLHPGALQEVLEKVKGRPEEAFVSAVVLRSVQRAVYSPEARGHYALAARHYLHFTSPIRRYPDLLAHRRLKALLLGEAGAEAERALLAERLPVMAEHTSATERRAEQSERDLLQWKKVRFLDSRVGETFRGRVTGVQPFGLFVQLDELFVDGLVPVRTMADDYYVYEPEAHRLTGERSGRRFQLADAVEVVLVGVDHRHRGLDLKIVGMPEPRQRQGRGRPARGAGRRR
jgi:ribonuclease R